MHANKNYGISVARHIHKWEKWYMMKRFEKKNKTTTTKCSRFIPDGSCEQTMVNTLNGFSWRIIRKDANGSIVRTAEE